jgi:CO/xanthine dehydrogenase Mo-binding subunit
VVAEIEVNRRTGKISALHLYGAQVAGLAVYLPGIENQIEGNLIVGASRALLEEVPFSRSRSLALQSRWHDGPTFEPTISVFRRKGEGARGGEP